MANPEHLEILRQGVAAWNEWRKKYPEIRPNFSGVDLSEANLSSANLSEADFSGASLSKANLSYSDLSRALLDGTDITEANLINAKLSLAHLSGTDLGRANLFGAILIGTVLNQVDLTEADLSSSELAFTMFGDVDLSVAKGLESIHHMSSSSIGIDTLYRSNGNIPVIFLRGAGVPDTFIDYARSLVNQPIEYYSCFISYSNQDQAFAERLYHDLQTIGIRCWFAPVSLRPGDNIRASIDEAIRIYNKLLLILSKHSLSSDWVAKEVNAALTKEKVQKTTILFPIRLDNTILENSSQWLERLRLTRHIGDFRDWQDHDAYQQAFTRLTRDLTLSVAQETDKQERTV